MVVKQFPTERVIALTKRFAQFSMPEMFEGLVKLPIPKQEHLKIAEFLETGSNLYDKALYLAARIYFHHNELKRAKQAMEKWEKEIEGQDARDYLPHYHSTDEYYSSNNRPNLEARSKIAAMWMDFGEKEKALNHALILTGTGNCGVKIEQLKIAAEVLLWADLPLRAAQALVKMYQATPETFERAMTILNKAELREEAIAICDRYSNPGHSEFHEVVAKAYVMFGLPDKAFDIYILAGKIDSALAIADKIEPVTPL